MTSLFYSLAATPRRQRASNSDERVAWRTMFFAKSAHAALVGLAVLGLVACNKGVTDAPQPRTTPTQPAVTRPVTPVVTVPSADAVLPSAGVAPNATSPTGRSNTSLTRSEEANAMPLPGQNNDHSAPVTPSSAPKRANSS